MNEFILRLLPDGQDLQELVLREHRLENSILDIANTSFSHVFCDHRYRAQIISNGKSLSNLAFLLNGNVISINYSPETGDIVFCDEAFGSRIFLECYGFVQITIAFDDEDGTRRIMDTDYIQVMVRKGRQNDSVRRMTEYVYSQNSDLLYGKTLPKEAAGLKETAQKTLESRILLLKQIAVVYEENYRYFKMNCRFRTVPREKVDHFEKMQFVSHNTLQYISQHPEELQRVYHSSGIKLNNSYYQPNKTLVTDMSKSTDIYENQVVVGFLKYLLNEICRIERELISITKNIPQKMLEIDEYVTSSYFIYANTIASVRLILADIQLLHRKYTTLFYSYADALPVSDVPISRIPRLTHIFKSVPQYHQVFDCTNSWFSKGAFSLNEEYFMLSFIKMSMLYEVYVLAKLVNYFRIAGYKLKSADKIIYPYAGRFHENTQCNNRFEFENETGRVTVYYQPVIYNRDMQSVSGIGLYRNTSISFPKIDLGSSKGKYYTPDYLIKYEYNDRQSAKYLLADAKFSTIKTVQTHQVAEVVYKYLFSISPITSTDQIIGLCIFNGQSDEYSDTITNIYDFELTTPISPKAEIVTMTENEEDNSLRHESILHNSVGLFTTIVPQAPIQLPPPSSPKAQSGEEQSHVSSDNISPLEDPTSTRVSDSQMPKPDNSKARTPAQATKPKPNIKSPRKSVDVDSIELSSLILPGEGLARLNDAGFNTVGDLVPNHAKKDLSNNPLLNRELRRKFEARLKQKKIYLK